jgi:hypothetical protein
VAVSFLPLSRGRPFDARAAYCAVPSDETGGLAHGPRGGRLCTRRGHRRAALPERRHLDRAPVKRAACRVVAQSFRQVR